MMRRQKLNWTLMLLLVPILILGLTACGGQGESEAPPASTAEEKGAEAEETKAAEEPAAETPAQTEETTETAEEPEETIEVREATTVIAATQMIDLHKLPLPDGAELMGLGYPEPGSLRYTAPIELDAAVDLYRTALTDQGWQEDVEAGHIDKASASLFFMKEDFKLSLSVGMGEDTTMVSLTNHGNIDLRALPQMADAEDVYYFPSTLSYFSPTDVATVADFTRRELAAQGWHEYTQPNTAMADDPERQSFTLIQNGLELSVSVGVAPAQDGKTGVQYSVSLLPLDLPVPDDATGLELEKMLLSLSYTTPADFETLFDYYSQEMTDLGWVVMDRDQLGMMTPERATLFFGNENLPPYSLVLDLIPSDGQTLATLRYYEPDELIELNSPGASSQTEETSTETELPQMMAFNAGGEIPDFPIPVDAQDVAYDADLWNITYTSPSGVETVVEFYRQLLLPQEWQENEEVSIVSEALASVRFERGEEVLQMTLQDMAGQTEVKANMNGALSVLETTGSGPGTGEETTMDSGPDASATNIPAFLTPADAQDVVYDADFGDITYTTPSDVETVVEFYRQSLPAEGWQESEISSAVDENFAFVEFSQGEDSLYIDITFFTDMTEVTMDMSFAPSLVAIIEGGGTATGSETTPSDSGPLSLIEEEGYPVPSDYEYLSTMESPFALIATFGSPSEVDKLVELYETELPGQGWEFSQHSLGEVARLYFESSDQKLSIDLRVNDGEISPDLAGQTSVELSIKDPAAATQAGILPPPGQARIMLMNGDEVELTATVNQQEFKLTPIPMSTEFPKDAPSIDLPPGQYTLAVTMPDGTVVNEDFEVGLDQDVAPDEVWAFILDASGMSPMLWPVY